MVQKKYKFLKNFSYLFGFLIIGYNLYLFDFNLPSWTDNYGLIHYSLEWTKQDFVNSIIWEHMGVPFFRFYVLVITSISGKFDDVAFLAINTLLYLIFIKIIIKTFTQSTNKRLNIIFLYLILSIPFYGLTIYWPFHSGLFLIFVTYFAYLIFTDQNINFNFILKFNICCLLLSATWPAFNYLIFILISTFFYLFKINKENRVKFFTIFFVFLLLQISIPLKNKIVFGYFGPSSLTGFAKMNSFWNWVSNEKKKELYDKEIIDYYFYNSITNDFNGNYSNFLKKNDETKNLVNNYSKKKKLFWELDNNWNYIYIKNGKKIKYLNERFKNDYIAMHEPAMVAIFNHLGKQAEKTFKLILKDHQIFDAFKTSAVVRISGQLLAPDLYYKFYPIYMTGWDQIKEIRDKSIPTFNIFKITNIKKSHERIPSSISVFAVIFSIFLSAKIILGLSLSKKKKFMILLKLYLLSIFLAFRISNASYFINFYTDYLFIGLILISIVVSFRNEKIFDYKNIKNEKIFLIPTSIILYFFLVIFIATIFEGTRYFGLITPIFFATLYRYILLENKFEEKKEIIYIL